MDKAQAHFDKMSKTPIPNLIIKLGIPTTISLLITNFYNLVDTYFVGSLGESQQGALGIMYVLQFIIQAFGFMFGQGAGVFIAASLAEKKNSEASKYISTSFFIGFFIGLVISILGLIFIQPLCYLLGSTTTILPYAKLYCMWILIACPFFLTSLVLNNNLRYEGLAFLSMVGLCSGAILNIFGDYLFISVLNMGVFGAGLSTALSQIASFSILLFCYITKAQGNIRLKSVVYKMSFILSICKVGFPSLVRQGMAAISGGIINNFAKPFGDAAIAAISIVNKYLSFIFCLGLGVAQGFQPVCAFNYQIKRFDRVKKAIIFTTLLSVGMLSIISFISFINADKVIRLFQDSQDVVDVGVLYLKASSITLCLMPISLVLNMLYQSTKQPLKASFFALLRSGVIQIPTVIIMCSAFDLIGLQLSTAINDTIVFLTCIPFLLHFIFK